MTTLILSFFIVMLAIHLTVLGRMHDANMKFIAGLGEQLLKLTREVDDLRQVVERL